MLAQQARMVLATHRKAQAALAGHPQLQDHQLFTQAVAARAVVQLALCQQGDREVQVAAALGAHSAVLDQASQAHQIPEEAAAVVLVALTRMSVATAAPASSS